MARPPYLLRHTSYRQAESAGQPISTSQLDAEFNDDYEVTNQLNRLLRGITDASGKLVNISAQLAQSLVGSTRFAPVVATTVFLTTVEWDASFSSGNVQVIVTGVILDTTTYTVADNSGFLEVTVSVPVSSGWVYVSAYSQGAGIATMLASTDPGDGASQVGINDVDALYVSTNVEGALAEIATSFNALLAALGTLSKIWTNDGVTVAGGPAASDFQMGGQRVIDMADAVNAQDAVTLQQLQSITQNLATLLAQFIRADGSVPWSGSQSLGGFKITDSALPVDPADLASKAYVDSVVPVVPLAFWGKINDEVTISVTAAVALTANRLHVVSGTAGDYTITLPVAPPAGTVVGLLVREYAAADKQYRLDAGGGVDICGRTQYLVLLHTNVALLMWDGTRWLPLVLCLDTPWINAGPITITAVTTNPTKGTVVVDAMIWRRIGAACAVRYQYHQSTGGLDGSGIYRIKLPFTPGPLTQREPEGSSYIAGSPASVGQASVDLTGLVGSRGPAYPITAGPQDVVNIAPADITGSTTYVWGSTSLGLATADTYFTADLTFQSTDW